MKILTIGSKSKFLHLLFTGIFLYLFIIQSAGQKRDFKEAQIYITAQATQQLVANRGFTAFEPLEQPDENLNRSIHKPGPITLSGISKPISR